MAGEECATGGNQWDSVSTGRAINAFKPVAQAPDWKEAFYELAAPEEQRSTKSSTKGKRKLQLAHNPNVDRVLDKVLGPVTSASGSKPVSSSRGPSPVSSASGSKPVSSSRGPSPVSSASGSKPVSSSRGPSPVSSSRGPSPVSSARGSSASDLSSSGSSPVSSASGSSDIEDVNCRICHDLVGDLLWKEVRDPQDRLAQTKCCGSPYHRRCLEKWWKECDKNDKVHSDIILDFISV
eukprot:g22096.t1